MNAPARRLRVVVVSAWPPQWLTDGTSLILHHHLRRLAGRHDVTVLHPDAPDGGRPRVDAVLDVPVDVRPYGPQATGGLGYVRRRLRSEWSGEPAHVHWVERRALVGALRELVGTADVLHLHGWGTAQLARLAPDVPAVHVAVDAWELGHRNRLLPGWRRLLDASQARKIARHERRHYPRCAAVVVVAERDAAHLRAAVPDAHVVVVPNGVESGDPPDRSAVTPGLLGFHGSFETEANAVAARTLVGDVLPLVRQRRPEAAVLLVGRSPGDDVRGLARHAAVEVTGAVPDVRPHLERMSVYVAPMTAGTGLKNKVLEAMAAGVPVVGTPLALEGVAGGPGVVEAPTPAAVAAAVADLLADRDARDALGRAGRERVLREYTWHRSAESIERLWYEAVSA